MQDLVDIYNRFSDVAVMVACWHWTLWECPINLRALLHIHTSWMTYATIAWSCLLKHQVLKRQCMPPQTSARLKVSKPLCKKSWLNLAILVLLVCLCDFSICTAKGQADKQTHWACVENVICFIWHWKEVNLFSWGSRWAGFQRDSLAEYHCQICFGGGQLMQ